MSVVGFALVLGALVLLLLRTAKLGLGSASGVHPVRAGDRDHPGRAERASAL